MGLLSSLISLVLYAGSLQAFTLADRMSQAEPGDFLVTEQDKNYSLLLIREVSDEVFVFEEISVPTRVIYLPGMDWKDWTALGAPGHASWIQYEIDRKTLQLSECYSASKKGWLHVSESEQFFSGLLSLNLVQVSEEEKRKIGPPPPAGEPDLRPAWSPPIKQGTGKKKIPCRAFKTYWPKDDTLLSLCRITLYFPYGESTPFPLWIEANNGHFNYSVRGIAFGKGLQSPLNPTVPKRPIRIVRTDQTDSHKILRVAAPAYYQDFSVFLFDPLSPLQKIGPVPYELLKGEGPEDLRFQISKEILKSFLSENRRYKWVIETQKKARRSSESEDFFIWKP